MAEKMNDLGFRIMSMMFKCRDLFAPRKKILEEVGLKEGDRILDFGCGPGS